MRFFISTCLLILYILTACTPIKVQTQAPYQSREFRSNNLKKNGLALLPTTNKEYGTSILQHAAQYLQTRIGNSYVQPRTVGQILNHTNMLSVYRDAIETYDKTGINDYEKFKQIGIALRVRYLLKIDSREITSQQRTESTSFIYDNDVDIDSNEIRKNTIIAIIIDCNSGEIVWKGVSKSTAKESNEFYNRPNDNQIIEKGVFGLMEQLFRRTHN